MNKQRGGEPTLFEYTCLIIIVSCGYAICNGLYWLLR